MWLFDYFWSLLNSLGTLQSALVPAASAAISAPSVSAAAVWQGTLFWAAAAAGGAARQLARMAARDTHRLR
jgi:hypothetical protein